MTIDLAFITYNRLDYTKVALASVLADPTEEFSLTIWDNASTDDTADYLNNEVNDPRICDIIFSKENVGQTKAVDNIWSQSKADLLGKLDNDCILTPGWTRTLAKAHADIENLGVIACWHFFEDDFDYERAKHKIQAINGHRILRHPWTCGTGLLIKRTTYQQLGPFDLERNNTGSYWKKMAAKGMINGFYYPLILQEHMDDPKSKYCLIQDAESFKVAKETTVGLQSNRYQDIEGRMQWRDEIIRNLMDDPYDLKCYVGWRPRARRFGNMIKKKCFVGE